MSKWSGRSRGTVLGYCIFIKLIQWGGVKSAYRLLKFVSFYYYLFAASARKSIVQFYTQALQMPKTKALATCRQNFYCFGQTLIDRIAFLTGKTQPFSHDFIHEEYLQKIQQNGKGGILISAHLGNWETAGNLLKKRITSNINVVMVEAEAQKIKQLLDHTTGGSQFKIIAIKDDLSHIIKISNALAANELIAMHGDRYTEDAKTISLTFLGKKAQFPLGPFLIASKFDAPVTFVFAVKKEAFHYQLSATLPITEKMKPEAIALLYVTELEKKVREYPEQWFNYYDFYSA
jgi:predicted LPLAT superfamily acyltransferase